MLRFVLIAAGVACLGACTPAATESIVATASPDPLPATATPFLPRGFIGLPSAAVSTSSAEVAIPTLASPPAAERLDLEMAAVRLNLLRGEDGRPPLLRAGPLDRIAQGRAETLAASGSLWHVSDGGLGAEVEGELSASGFGGQVGEVVLSVGTAEQDPLGLVLQALLTDPSNRDLVLAPQFRLLGLGAASDASSWYIVGLLAQAGPTE